MPGAGGGGPDVLVAASLTGGTGVGDANELAQSVPPVMEVARRRRCRDLTRQYSRESFCMSYAKTIAHYVQDNTSIFYRRARSASVDLICVSYILVAY